MPPPPRGSGAWLRHLAIATIAGGASGAVLLSGLGVSPIAGSAASGWVLARGPLQLAALAPLLSANRPGRWSPAWGLGVALSLLAPFAWSPGLVPVPVVLVAMLGNAVLGVGVGLSADPLLPLRASGERRR